MTVSCGTLQLGGYRVEGAAEIAADRSHDCDGGNGDKRGYQPISDCRDTRLVLDQLSKKSARWVLLADEHQGPDPDRIGVGQTPIDGILRQVAEDERQKEHSASRPEDDLDYAYVQVEAPWRRSKRNRA